MKKIYKIYIIIFSLLFSIVAHAETISIRADNWYPFNGDPKAEMPGYMIEVAKVIFEKAGHKLDYQIMPWARCIKEAETGKIDAIVGAAKGDAPNLLYPDVEIGKTLSVIYTRKDSSWKYAGVDSFNGIKVGIILDYSYDETFDEYVHANKADVKKIEALGGDDALPQNIKKLQLGRIDALVSEKEVFEATLAQMKLASDEFKQAGELDKKDLIYIAFSPKKESSKTYAKILSDGILELRQSGELQKILSKYGLKDWKN